MKKVILGMVAFVAGVAAAMASPFIVKMVASCRNILIDDDEDDDEEEDDEDDDSSEDEEEAS